MILIGFIFSTVMNKILYVLLCGVYDEGSILNSLRRIPLIVKIIWLDVKSFYTSHIKLPVNYDHYNSSNPPKEVGNSNLGYDRRVAIQDSKFFTKICEFHMYDGITENELTAGIDILFPPPKNIKINMMPYVFGGDKFESYKLPSYLKPYFDIIKLCYGSWVEDLNKIFYLTIDEGLVEPGRSQRRPGIHTDNSGPLNLKGSNLINSVCEGEGAGKKCYFYWGDGVMMIDEVSGGIFIASNVPNSCRLWNCKIEKGPVNDSEIIGENGDCEHIKEFLPADKEVVLEKNKLYWMTDRTPHESLPLENGTYRQFIRVVTANVSHWFADHSTRSPCGVHPDSNITKVVTGNKFDKTSLEVIKHEKYFKSD